MQRNGRKTIFFLLLIGAMLLGRGSSVSADSPWGADFFPNIPLITQDGETVHFFHDLIKDKVVAINFIFTRCPDSCPLETARLREVQKILGDRIGNDVFLYSITIDPEYDTPAVLKKYMEKFDIGSGWTFLTGKKEDITNLRRKMGMYREEEADNLAAHSLSLIIGNQKTGQWMKSSPFENPYILATQIGSWLHNWKLPPRKEQDYAKAPEVRNISQGETLFRTRCASCHTIGAQDDAKMARRPIGPDLLNVTRSRDRAWLTRWLAEPDKMLAEKDPMAMALFAQYNNIPMPNLRLGDQNIQDLLTYMEEESSRLEQHHDHGAENQAHGAQKQ